MGKRIGAKGEDLGRIAGRAASGAGFSAQGAMESRSRGAVGTCMSGNVCRGEAAGRTTKGSRRLHAGESRAGSLRSFTHRVSWHTFDRRNKRGKAGESTAGEASLEDTTV